MSPRRILEVVLEFVLAIAVVVAILAYAERGPVPWMPSIRWWGLAGETAILFGYMLRASRPYRKFSRFWLGFITFLILHLVGCSIALLKVEQWPLMWFVFLGFGEWVALAWILEHLLREPLQSEFSDRREHS